MSDARPTSAPSPVRILLVDDQRLLREGIRALLELHDDLQVIGEASDGAEALRLVPELKPDVAVMDLRMPGLNGVAATRRLVAQYPTVRVLILTTFDDDAELFEALRAGAAGYVLKDIPGGELAAAIRTVHTGGTHLAPSVAAKVVAELSRLQSGSAAVMQASHVSPTAAQPTAPAALKDLTPRERDVLRLLAAGATNAEIAAQLVIGEGTAKNHVSNILGRLGLRDRTQAALFAREHGLG
jgi:DNA-binding NarL/FixJ family response regulator